MLSEPYQVRKNGPSTAFHLIYNTRARGFAAPGRLQMPAYTPVLTGPPLAGEPLPTACQCLRTCGLPYPGG